MSSYYIIFALFAVVAYFIVTDENVAAAFTYVLEIVSRGESGGGSQIIQTILLSNILFGEDP